MLSKSQVEKMISVLNADGVVLSPTDTVYGLLARFDSKEAVQKIYNLKNRPRSKSLPFFVSSLEQAEDLIGKLPESAVKLINSLLMPGGLSLLVSVSKSVSFPDPLDTNNVVIRIPDNQCLLEVIEKVGPLVATSANRSGDSNTADIDHILQTLSGEPDYVISGSVTDTHSTILDCRGDEINIVREGAVTVKEIRKVVRIGLE